MSAAIALDGVAAGLADPVRDSQAVFRAVLDAMAAPGRVVEVPGGHGQLEHHASGAFALALIDFETPVWLSERFAGWATWLRFHCGCPLTADPGTAAFAFAGSTDLPALSAFDAGDAKYPDRAATLVIDCPALTGGLPVTLAGPGIKDRAVIAPGGLGRAFWTDLGANRSQFQLGVDVVLTSGRSLLALPRATRLLEGDN